MLAQFMDIFFAESDKRLASQLNLLYKKKERAKPGYGRILSFGSRASLVLFSCGEDLACCVSCSEGAKKGKWVFRHCRKGQK